MPENQSNMPDFEGRVYKLHLAGMDEEDDVCYIGSTTRTLAYRFDLHKHQATNPEQTKCRAACFFEEGNDVLITLLEEGAFESKSHMEERERFWIEKHPNATNKNLPGRGWKERWIANREHNILLHKQWMISNSDKVKAYNLANKERSNQKAQARYDSGYAEKRAAAKKVRVKCEVCQKEMNQSSLWQHKKDKHTDT